MSEVLKKRKPIVVDLFAGCGGLSLGLEQAGFDLALAVEKSPMAAETFYHNFIKKIKNSKEWENYINKPLLEQAEQKLVVDNIEKVVKSKDLIKKIKEQNVDLLVGGPPCQGFSLAGKRNPNDKRNQMPLYFLEMVRKIQPKAVIMENVAGINSKFKNEEKETPLTAIKISLQDLGYTVQPVLLNAYHYGVPQQRPRIMLIAIKNSIAKNLKINTTDSIWKSEKAMQDENYDYMPLMPKVEYNNKNLTVEDAFKKIKKNALNNNCRNHSYETTTRFRLYQYFQKCNIPFKILNFFAENKNLKNISCNEQINIMLANASYPAISPDGTILAKDKKELVALLIKLSTKKHSQRPLKPDSPSPTIVTIPDDYVHPYLPRTLTVREMATLQSFPQDFEFRSKETTGGTKRKEEVPQYTQVGNAVPPKLAKKVGETVLKILVEAENYNLK